MPEYPEISVIIPAYNTGSHLGSCLDSVLGQSFADWELIICDDGSTDETGKIADEYAETDSRIKVIHKANAGVSAARNSCLDVAKGRYVAFVDADDTLDKDYLNGLLSHAKEHDADITQCSFRFVKDNGERSADPYAADAIYKSRDGIMEAYFSGPVGDIRVSVWAKLFRRDLFDDIRFDTDLRLFEDAYYVYECCKKAETVFSFSEPLYFYRQHNDSTMCSRLTEIYPDYFAMFDMQKTDYANSAIIRKKIEAREAAVALWLMRLMVRDGKKRDLWILRKNALRVTNDVHFSHAPFLLKLKLAGVALVPHLYFAMLKKKVASNNEKN